MKLPDLLLIGVLIWAVTAGSTPQQPPAPQDGAVKTVVTFETLYADLMEEAAKKLDAGEFSSDVLLKNYLAERFNAAWNIALRDGVATEMDAVLKDGYTPEKAAKLLREWAQDLRGRL